MEKIPHKQKIKLSPYLFIALGFLGTIIIGSLLLFLPISVQDGQSLSFMDSFFIATSAVCVTGLTPVEISTTLSVFGKVVLALLIQIGGLGLVTFAYFIISMLGRKLGIKERVVIKEALNQDSMHGLVRMIKTIIITTFSIELIGAVICFIIFIQQYDFQTSLGYSLFHSISSFNNAGFDIFADESMIPFANNVWLNLSTSALIIIGGIGFIVLFDIKQNKKFSKLSIHSKIVLSTTLILLAGGTLLLKFTSWNELTWLEAFFQSVSTRTAGYNTVALNTLSTASLALIIFLMFVGASPCSTGGGIKTTTFFTIIKSIFRFASGKDAKVFHRKIAEKSIYKAYGVAVLAISTIFIATFLVMICDPELDFEQVIFEVVSAFGTVGLSLGITAELSSLSKCIICVIMFFGRLGPLTIASIWNSTLNKQTEGNIQYIEEKMIIG